MSWGRLDDTIDDSPKFAGIDLAAAGLWLMCQPQALRRGDGFVPQGVPQRFTKRAAPRLIALLVARGLWDVADGGWTYHDFGSYSKLHQKRSEAGSKGATARWQTDGKPMAKDASRDGKEYPVPEPEPVTRLTQTLPTVVSERSNGTPVGWYVEACQELGSIATPRMKARIGQEANRLIALGFEPADIRLAIGELARRNGSPTLLEQLANDARLKSNGVPMGRAFDAPLRVNSHDALIASIRQGRAS
jgi:hypothetical protein